jgi:hypothetical protein
MLRQGNRDSLPGMVLRGEAARLLGCSRRRVQQFEAEGRLRAVVDAKGIHHFARADVLAFASKRGRPHADRVHGTIAAQVFALFRESVELPEIVMRTQQSPVTIRALYEEYRRPLEVPGGSPPDLVDYDRSSRELDARIATLQGRELPAPPTRPMVVLSRDGGGRARGE